MKNKGLIIMILGLVLLIAALALAIYNVYEGEQAGQSAQQTVEVLGEALIQVQEDQEKQETILLPEYVLNPDMEMPVETVNGIDYIGVLRIPVLELELPIAKDWDYDKLKTTPCRFTGSPYRNDLIICAHNFSSHFGNLRNLQKGDTLTFTDMAGNEFHYAVALTEILQPTAVEDMLAGDWDLSLFTCTVGGQTRVTVRCERTDAEVYMGALS